VKDQGGILHNYIREVEVSCLPLDIPEYVEVEVSELNMGDSIQLSSLSFDKASIVGDVDQPIVSVLAPRIVKEEVDVEEEGLEEGAEGEETETESSEDEG
jgi:large subunit ribosomal protein L25